MFVFTFPQICSCSETSPDRGEREHILPCGKHWLRRSIDRGFHIAEVRWFTVKKWRQSCLSAVASNTIARLPNILPTGSVVHFVVDRQAKVKARKLCPCCFFSSYSIKWRSLKSEVQLSKLWSKESRMLHAIRLSMTQSKKNVSGNQS